MQAAHPPLQAILARCNGRLVDFKQAVHELIAVAYGHDHGFLGPQERNHRLNLYKLGNLIDRLDLLDDPELIRMGHRCPEQLRSYHCSLKATMPVAYHRGIAREHLEYLDELHQELWSVLQTVTSQAEALS